MTLTLAHVTVDWEHPATLAVFWSAALRLPIRDGATSDFAALDGGGSIPSWLWTL